MGFIHPGVPPALAGQLVEKFRITTFVETGTHKGRTAEWASGHFEKVFTIEGSDVWFQRTQPRLAPLGNVSMLFGQSAEVLPPLVAQLTGPALFWLDAHWSGRQTAGADQQCPLLGEIAAINQSPLDHFVLIDDARLFLAPPEPPHDVDQWPDLGAIVAALNAARPKYVVAFEDALIAVPPAARRVVQQYCLARMAAEKNRTFPQRIAAKLRRLR